MYARCVLQGIIKTRRYSSETDNLDILLLQICHCVAKIIKIVLVLKKLLQKYNGAFSDSQCSSSSCSCNCCCLTIWQSCI